MSGVVGVNLQSHRQEWLNVLWQEMQINSTQKKLGLSDLHQFAENNLH